jgi:copper homeostasis protein
MSIVNTHDQAEQRDALLEVVVLHPRDVAGADAGGADRLFVVTAPEHGGLSPEPAVVSTICRETEIPVRAMLRLNEGLSTTGGELARLAGLAEDFLAVGADGVAFGFLDRDLEVDVEVCSHLARTIGEVPWTFHHAIDSALDTRRSWRRVSRLPGVDAVLSAGSARGLGEGCDDLADLAADDPEVAGLLMAGGGLRAEHVPWLVRAGVRQFLVGSTVRPDGSWTKAYVDAGHVRAWRMLLDDAVDHVREPVSGRGPA